MAIEYIKKSTNEKQRLDDNEKVKEIVENTLKEIELRGDESVSYTHLTLPTIYSV